MCCVDLMHILTRALALAFSSGIVVGDNSTVSINNCLFNTTIAPGWDTVGVAGNPDSESSKVSISNSLFANMPIGISAEYGHYTVTNSAFVDCGTGIERTTGLSIDGRSPLVVSHNLFNASSTAALAVSIGDKPASGSFVISDNRCAMASAYQFKIAHCLTPCIIENNSGCASQDHKGTELAIE